MAARKTRLAVVVVLVGVIATTIGLILKCQHRFFRALLFAWSLFLLSLAPYLGFVDVGYMRYSLVADHYQHVALIAVVALIATCYCILRTKSIGTTIANALVVGLVGGYALLAFGRATLMSDPEALYTTTLQSNPGSGLCEFLIGKVLIDEGKNRPAQEHLLAAIKLDPDYARAHNNLGVTLTNDHRINDAIAQYDEALRLKPNYAEAAYNLGFALTDANRLDEAIAAYLRALETNPQLFQARVNLAALFANQGKLADAISQSQQALEIAQSLGMVEFVGLIQHRLDEYRSAAGGDKSATSPQPVKQTPSKDRTELPTRPRTLAVDRSVHDVGASVVC